MIEIEKAALIVVCALYFILGFTLGMQRQRNRDFNKRHGLGPFWVLRHYLDKLKKRGSTHER